jgi:cardiolipin synthase
MPARIRHKPRPLQLEKPRAKTPGSINEIDQPAPVRIARVALGTALALVLLLIAAATVIDHDTLPDRLSFPDSLQTVRASAPSFERTLSLYTQTQFEPGNSATILLNGDSTYPQLWRDLRSAQRTIFVAQYFAEPGAIIDSLGAILAERARAGVRVRVLLDGFGAASVTDAWRDSLRAAGAHVEAFRPLKWRTIFRAGRRSHARMISVDGRIAYAGGFGFADKWLGEGDKLNEWRETSVRVEGSVAEQMQAAFGIAWFEAVGELVAGNELFVPPGSYTVHGNVRAGVLHSAPVNGVMGAQRFLALAVMSAERRLYISNSYFVPTAELRRLLVRAAQRGVDVRVLTAGTGTDVRIARSASRNHYDELLEGGVRIFEYTPTMMHAKTLVVDGRWASIGSMNFDPQSIGFNDEANIVLLDAPLAVRMEEIFAADVARSREVTLADLANRSWRERFADWLATQFERLL